MFEEVADSPGILTRRPSADHADGKALYYSYSSAVWAQPVAGEPKRITEGIDVTLDPQGHFLYVKRATKGTLGIVRIPASGGDARALALALYNRIKRWKAGTRLGPTIRRKYSIHRIS